MLPLGQRVGTNAMSEPEVFLVYTSEDGIRPSLIWIEWDERTQAERLWEEYLNYDGRITAASVPYELADADVLLDEIEPNYSRIRYLQCAECGANSWLDYLCSECRDG